MSGDRRSDVRSRRARAEPSAIAHSLAALLAAGVSPHAVWDAVAIVHGGESQLVLDLVGRPATAVAETIRARSSEPGWCRLACLWEVADETGAPLSPALLRHSRAEQMRAEAGREVDIALAGSRATGVVLGVLPVVGLLSSALLGFDTLGLLFTTATGWLLCAAAGSLILASALWRRRLVAGVWRNVPSDGFPLEVAVVVLEAGRAPAAASSVADAALARVGTFSGEQTESVELSAYVRLADRTGVPIARLLIAEAERARGEQRRELMSRIRRLETRQLLPLAFCSLPAFFLLTVLPIVFVLLAQSFSGITV